MVKALVAIILVFSFVAPVVTAAPAHTKAAAQPQPAKPDWVELTPPQQTVLAPLKDDWKDLDTSHRAKWVKVAKAYPKLKPEQQQRLQAQMRDWMKLTPEQRRIARANYKTIKKLPPEKRKEVKAQWHEYQQSLVAKPETAGETAATTTTAPQ